MLDVMSMWSIQTENRCVFSHIVPLSQGAGPAGCPNDANPRCTAAAMSSSTSAEAPRPGHIASAVPSPIILSNLASHALAGAWNKMGAFVSFCYVHTYFHVKSQAKTGSYNVKGHSARLPCRQRLLSHRDCWDLHRAQSHAG